MQLLPPNVNIKSATVVEISLTPGQCRAARALIGWSRDELASNSQIALRTIVDFERGARSPHSPTLASIKSALEAAGIEFITENGGGAGVRLKRGSGH
jgi:transcriptional regulator with XRE-family HTH domain